MLSAEHESFRRPVREFVEKELAPNADEWEASSRLPRSVWRRLGELGFLGIELPERYGGTGADFLYTAILCEELARCRSAGVVMGVVASTDMSTPHIVNLGTDEQKDCSG